MSIQCLPDCYIVDAPVVRNGVVSHSERSRKRHREDREHRHHRHRRDYSDSESSSESESESDYSSDSGSESDSDRSRSRSRSRSRDRHSHKSHRKSHKRDSKRARDSRMIVHPSNTIAANSLADFFGKANKQNGSFLSSGQVAQPLQMRTQYINSKGQAVERRVVKDPKNPRRNLYSQTMVYHGEQARGEKKSRK